MWSGEWLMKLELPDSNGQAVVRPVAPGLLQVVRRAGAPNLGLRAKITLSSALLLWTHRAAHS